MGRRVAPLDRSSYSNLGLATLELPRDPCRRNPLPPMMVSYLHSPRSKVKKYCTLARTPPQETPAKPNRNWPPEAHAWNLNLLTLLTSRCFLPKALPVRPVSPQALLDTGENAASTTVTHFCNNLIPDGHDFVPC